MGPGDHVQYFATFNLPADASLENLDAKYHSYTLELQKGKNLDAAAVSARQAELDNAYYHLIQQYIRKECESEEYQPRDLFSIHDIQVKRDEALIGQVLDYGDEDWMQNESMKETFEIEDELDIHEDEQQSFVIVMHTGNIFNTPAGSVIIHAVNCLGVWGSGFAAQLKSKFPAAFRSYREHCIASKTASSLLGRCLLIPPESPASQGHPRWIACLFTSVGYGKPDLENDNPGRDTDEHILVNTGKALCDFRNNLSWARNHPKYRDCEPGRLYSPKFNSGLFQVPWEQTKAKIVECFEDFEGIWTVLSPAS